MARSDNVEISDDSRKGPSTLTLTISGIISLGTVLASGVTSYNALQSDIAALKRGEQYQEKVNEQNKEDTRVIRSEIKELRSEQRETMREFGEKVDRLADKWQRRIARDDK
jgi:hypothetical protein